MTPWKFPRATLLALFLAGTAQAQTAPTYLGKQQFTAAQLASSQGLTFPSGTTYADFIQECSVAGTNGVCLRFDPGGAANSVTSPPLGASLQLVLGETPAPSLHVILDSTATGAAGSGNTLTVLYWGHR